ncbi:MAG: zonular occludens toxin domain-containing protein [Anaerolineales bacterium]|nr:zonular occludens toxin domain-containing protein [Anaerolineales bacterium]
MVDLSKRPSGISTGVWDEKIKPLLIDAFLGVLIREAEYSYQGEKSLNTLVVLDEAHRFAPQERDNNERKQRIKRNLVDAVRTTRKYGLGWMFLSQTLSSLDNEIVQQLRISFFGFGLSMGTEFRKLQELVGGKGEYLKLYQQFRDPHSSFDTASREYSFMTIGPVSPLSFAGTPLFLNAFSEAEAFISANGLITQGKML